MSVKMKTFFFFFLCFLDFARSYNVKTKGSKIFKSGSSDALGLFGLFGHSVALSQSYAFIGAPHDSTHGNVFKCPLQSSQCSPMTIQGMTHKTTKNFFGSTVTIQNDNVVTCAYGEFLEERKKNFYETEAGVCYKAKSSSNVFEKDFGWLPESQDSIVRTPEDRAWNWDYGWKELSIMGSQHIQTEKGAVVFNTPFARHKKYKTTIEQPKPKKDEDPKGGDRITGTIVRYGDNFTVAEGEWHDEYAYDKDDPHTFDETGSSIVQGKFFEDSGEHFAIGAPNADRYRGKVYFCKNCFERRGRGDELIQPSEGQMGERFGFSMTPFKIDQRSTTDDLIVGAPLHCHKRTDESTNDGRIIVFKNKYGEQFDEVKVLESPTTTSSGRFGFVIANLGDIDNNGYGDFVVGAPGIDRVFVYYGDKDTSYTVSQEIKGSEFNIGLGSGFGYALSQKRQKDRSFAVGAPFKNSAVVLKTRRVVSFNPDIVISPSQIDPRDNQFTMTLEITLDKLTNPDQDKIKVQINFKDSLRFIIDSPEPFEMDESVEDRTVSKKVVVRPKGGKNFVSKKKVDLRIRGDLVFDLECTDDQSCPMIRSFSDKSEVDIQDDTKMVLPFDKTIGLEYVCKPNPADCQCQLTSNPTESQKSREIVIGETDFLNFDLDISNIGDDLADWVNALFRFELPIPGFDPMSLSELVRMFTITSREGHECVDDVESGESGISGRKCELPIINVKDVEGSQINPKFKMSIIPKDLVKTLWDLLKVGFSGLKDGASSLFPIKLTIKPSLEQERSECKNMKNGMEMEDIVVNLVFKSKFEIEPDYQPSLGYDEDKPLVHSFKVQNQGPSFTHKSTNVTFFIPKTNQIELASFSPNDITICTPYNTTTIPFQGGFQAKDQKPTNQMVCKDGSECVVMECQIQAGLRKDEEKEFKIGLSFQRSKATNDTNFVVTTVARIEDQGLQAKASTELYSNKDERKGAAKAKVWPMVLGACLGLLIIIIMGLILWKTGLLAKMRPYQKKENEQNNTRQMQSLSILDLPAD